MRKFETNLLLAFLVVGELFSCTSSQKIEGTYESKFPIIGFFGTRIALKSDSTFNYLFRGDLYYDSSYGNYKVENPYVILEYKYPVVDTTGQFYLLNKNPAEGNRPKRLIIGHNKLFKVDSNGQREDKAYAQVKRRKLIPFRTKTRNIPFGHKYTTIKKKTFYYKKK